MGGPAISKEKVWILGKTWGGEGGVHGLEKKLGGPRVER